MKISLQSVRIVNCLLHSKYRDDNNNEDNNEYTRISSVSFDRGGIQGWVKNVKNMKKQRDGRIISVRRGSFNLALFYKGNPSVKTSIRWKIHDMPWAIGSRDKAGSSFFSSLPLPIPIFF